MEDWFNCLIRISDPFQKHKAIHVSNVVRCIDDKLETLDVLNVMERTFMTGTGE
jgi:hypothetical protein